MANDEDQQPVTDPEGLPFPVTHSDDVVIVHLDSPSVTLDDVAEAKATVREHFRLREEHPVMVLGHHEAASNHGLSR